MPCFAIWFYTAVLTTAPALLFASADEDAPDAGASSGAAGVGCFVFALWTLGWGFLWYRAPGIQPVQPEQHLLGMPPSLLLKLKLVSVCGECYSYCGFSLFPALPWKAMEVPPSVLHPQAIMLAGCFTLAAAVKEDGFLLQFASEELRNDREIVLL